MTRLVHERIEPRLNSEPPDSEPWYSCTMQCLTDGSIFQTEYSDVDSRFHSVADETLSEFTVMTTRKEFLKTCALTACAAGVCCSAVTPEVKASEDGRQACDPRELSDTQNRADAARLRFSRLVEIIETRLPEQERKQMLHALGAKCADTYRGPLLDRYKGNINGFLAEGRRNWMAEADYDEAHGTIRIVDKGPGCSCPMVKEGVTPPSFCDCTLGWQEAAYSTILGRPVCAELEESILRGGKKCIYRIRVI
jgi:hypothetical protein